LKPLSKYRPPPSQSKNSPHCPFQTPDITTPIRTIPTLNKKLHKIQLISNTPISKSNKVNKKIFSQHFIKALLSHSWENLVDFFALQLFEDFGGKFGEFWLIFRLDEMETFLRGIWRILGVFEANGILMNHLWDFPGLLDRAGWFWDLERRFISTRLVQGWPKSGARIRKSQNTEDLGKALQITKFRLNLDLKTREICWGARTIQNSWFHQIWALDPALIFQALFTSKYRQKTLFGPLIRSYQQNHEQILRAGKNDDSEVGNELDDVTLFIFESQTHRRTHRLLTRGIPTGLSTAFFVESSKREW
jgi:hypothetical protein